MFGDISDFQENLKTAFAQLRFEKDFAGVTLVCEDADDFKENKLILVLFFKPVSTKAKN